jgi:hypothetical protein
LEEIKEKLKEMKDDNERIKEEKGVLLESLWRKKEKMEESRKKVENMKEMMLRNEKEEGWKEREKKIVEMMKS